MERLTRGRDAVAAERNAPPWRLANNSVLAKQAQLASEAELERQVRSSQQEIANVGDRRCAYERIQYPEI